MNKHINLFLTTLKVFQYELTKPDILKKYINEELISNDIIRFFTKIYYLREQNISLTLNIKDNREKMTDIMAIYILSLTKENLDYIYEDITYSLHYLLLNY